MGALTGLVVDHDRPRTEGIDVDPIDLPREREAVAQIEPALQLRGCALRAEQHLEAPRLERQLGLGLQADEGFEVTPQGLVELAALEV